MKRSDGLFDLIHSLTPAEKRYFKTTVRGQKAKDQKYFLLFVILDKQLVYDENQLRELLKGEPLLKELHVTKNYLFESILKSLRRYHAKSIAHNTVLQLLEDYNILFQRGLFRLSHLKLHKAKKIAQQFYFHTLQMEIVICELRLAIQRRYSEKNIAYVSSLYSDLRRLLDQSKKNYDLSELTNTIFAKWMYDGRNRAVGGESEFDGILRVVQKEFSHETNDEFTKSIYNDLNKNYYYVKGNYKKAFIYAQMNFELFRNYADLRKNSPQHYLTIINDYYMCLLNSSFAQRPDFKQFQTVEKLLLDIERVPNADSAIKNNKVLISCCIRLSWCLSMKEYKRGITFCKTIEKQLPKYAEKWGKMQVSIVYLYYARLYFAVGDFKTSLEWINKILVDKEMEAFDEIACTARLFSLILYYELKEFDYLGYAIRNTSNFLNRKKHLYPYEQHILLFLKRACKVKDGKKQIEQIKHYTKI